MANPPTSISSASRRSPQPPLPPPKDLLSASSSHQSTLHSYAHHRTSPTPRAANPTSRISDIDLAEAVRDSVQIRGESPNLLDPNSSSRPVSTSSRKSPSPSIPHSSSGLSTNNNTTRFAPAHGYSQSSPDMSAIAQPQLPSAMMKAQNPFEQDEVEPPAGNVKAPTRPKQSRATTTAPVPSHLQSSPSGRAKVRRSMSSDSYALKEEAATKELTAGQKKAVDDKKGSKHADVIDTWDPTGLGSAMWHHSGPYDAAAPSRNLNQPQTRAPMHAFNGPPPSVSPSREKAPGAAPIPVAKDEAGRRRSEAKASCRATGGGLTGQYSTSVPASGGYFPDFEEPVDEATMARKERQKERDSKRRALKAAWGIDEPEPYEAFGRHGDQGDEIDREYQGRIPLKAVTEETLSPTKPLRSPGLRLGFGPRTPPIHEDLVSPSSEQPPIVRSGPLAGQPQPGVKRNKSLMQKIRTMRENSNVPFRSSSPSKSPNPPSTGTSSSPLPIDETNENPLVPAPTTTTAMVSPAPIPAAGRREPTDEMADALEELDLSPRDGGFVLVDSPQSKERAMAALQKEQAAREKRERERAESAGIPAFAVNRVKTLPLPPVGQVMPDFDDLIPRRSSPLENSQGAGVQRKTSMVKRFKDKVTK